MLDALLHCRPHVSKKLLVPRQSVVLADAPENSCALILLFSARGTWRFFNMVPLSPTAIRLLDLLAPLIECCRVVIVATTIQSICDVRPVSRPDVTIVVLQRWGCDYSSKVRRDERMEVELESYYKLFPVF